MKTCRECKSTEHVHRGLCRTCRQRDLDGYATVGATSERVPRSPDLEPPKSRPWIHRGGG